MQISSSSAATSSLALQALRDLFKTSATPQAGQALPTGATKAGGKGPPPGPPAGPPPASLNGGGFSTDTLASLLGTQEASSTSVTASSDVASKVVDEADTNGDGTISLLELAASLGADQSTLADAFAKVDSDGDGQITTAELDTGLKARQGGHAPHGPPPSGEAPSASDTALNVLASADANQSGSLNLSEIGSALGQDDTSSLTDALAALDTNGDGNLASDELTKAITAAFAKSLEAYAANTADTTTSSVSLAA